MGSFFRMRIGGSTFTWSMYLTNRAKDCVPVWPAEICWRPKTSDGIPIGIGVVDHDIRCIVRLYLGGEILCEKISYRSRLVSDTEAYCMNLNMIVHVLCLNSEQQRPEPFERAEISAYPEEIDLAKPSLLLRVIYPVPDTLEY